MKKNCGYAGKIKHSGTQNIKAPFGTGGGTKGTDRISGNDLRTGNGGKKSGK